MCAPFRQSAAFYLSVITLPALMLFAPAFTSQANASADFCEMSSCATLSSAVDDAQTTEKLEKGEVVVDLLEAEKTQFVVGKIIVKAPPRSVWPVLVNPYEFENKLSPRMTHVELILDKPEKSVMKCTLNLCFPFPRVNYTVESNYDAVSAVEFHRVSGFLRDFRGCWILRPCAEGKNTELCYAMFADPGIPIPKWMVREGVKSELPQMLTAIRRRVEAIASSKETAESKTIAASSALNHVRVAAH